MKEHDIVRAVILIVGPAAGLAIGMAWAYGLFTFVRWATHPKHAAAARVTQLRDLAAKLRNVGEPEEAARLTAEADQIDRELALGAAHKLLPRVEGDDR